MVGRWWLSGGYLVDIKVGIWWLSDWYVVDVWLIYGACGWCLVDR